MAHIVYRIFRRLSFVALLLVSIQLAAQTQTSLTTNNTAACSAAGYLPLGATTSYCLGAFPGYTDNMTNFAPLTQPHDPAVSGTWNISKGRGTKAGDIHSLLTSGSGTMVFAAMQNWFCYGTSTEVTVDGQVMYTCDNHMVVGYNSNDSGGNHAAAAIQDLWDRGFNGVSLNWSGDQNSCWSGSQPYRPTGGTFTAACPAGGYAQLTDQASQLVRNAVDMNHPTMRYYIQYADSAFKFTPNCVTADAYQYQCIENKIEADINNGIVPNYIDYASYLSNTPGNQPLVSFFIDETAYYSGCSASNPCNLNSGTCTSTTNCWQQIWTAVQAQFQTDGYNPYMLFENTTSHYLGDGAFDWVTLHNGGSTLPNTDTNVSDPASQLNWGTKADLDKNLAAGQASLSTVGGNGQNMMFIAGGWKGFDDRFANWSPSWVDGAPATSAPPYPRVTSQRCGQNWLDTLSEMNNYFTAANPQVYLQAITWDDYEEGTEIETGIDNCVSALTSSMSGATLNWTISFSGDGSENTVDHYEIYYSTDGATGQNLQDSGVSVATGTYTYNLASYNLPNPTVLYVQAVGKPSITNHLASGVLYNPVPSITSLSPTSGLAGTSVTISGSNFGSNQGTVTFNGTAAAISSWTSNTIVVSVPSGATSGNVVVTAGGQNSNALVFTIFAPAVLTTPPPSSTLSGSSVTFEWTAGTDVTAYMLYLGTTRGSNNLYSSGSVGTTSVAVTGIPTTAATIYATLYSAMPTGGWKPAYYTYTEAGTPTPAVLTTPTPSSTLPGSSVTFGWTKGIGVTAYMLYLGTTRGSNNLYNSGSVGTTSVAVTGLPTNAATIYATLYSALAGETGWKAAYYTYTESGTPTPAVLTTPTPSSTLPGSSVTFEWTKGVDVTAYMLYLGTTRGSNNLYNSGAVGTTSATVTGLPTTGATIYATLYSAISGVAGWKAAYYTYTEAAP